MKAQVKFALLVGLGTGVLTAGAAAQQRQADIPLRAQAQIAIFDSSQSGVLRQADWDDHRRCDGDRDRDDRGCYYRDRDGRYIYYRGDTYYGNGYYVAPTPYYAPNAGWYDRDGRWHAYDRDRDHHRNRHRDDDDRR